MTLDLKKKNAIQNWRNGEKMPKFSFEVPEKNKIEEK